MKAKQIYNLSQFILGLCVRKKKDLSFIILLCPSPSAGNRPAERQIVPKSLCNFI